MLPASSRNIHRHGKCVNVCVCVCVRVRGTLCVFMFFSCSSFNVISREDLVWQRDTTPLLQRFANQSYKNMITPSQIMNKQRITTEERTLLGETVSHDRHVFCM